MLRQILLLIVGAAMVIAQRRLALPDPRSCVNSKYNTDFIFVLLYKRIFLRNCKYVVQYYFQPMEYTRLSESKIYMET